MPVPSNCESTDAITGRTFLCVLDEQTTPGSHRTLPLHFRTKDTALFDRLDYSAQPSSEQALAEARAGRAFTPGTGPELNLTPATAPSDELQPYRSFTVKTVNQADYRLTASTVSGAAGDTVPVHNAGPPGSPPSARANPPRPSTSTSPSARRSLPSPTAAGLSPRPATAATPPSTSPNPASSPPTPSPQPSISTRSSRTLPAAPSSTTTPTNPLSAPSTPT